MTKIYVVSTGFDCDRERCLKSVAEQRGVECEHRWVDAAMQIPSRSALENFCELLKGIPSGAIVAWVDLDDWLAHPSVLVNVAALHWMGAWVTYGSFKYADGRAGFAAPYAPDEDIRATPWRATHLKTFRAELVTACNGTYGEPAPQDRPRGRWVPQDGEHARDQLIMFECMEKAGPDRCAFNPDVGYVYNYASSFEPGASPEEIQEEAQAVARIRAITPYARLESLP